LIKLQNFGVVSKPTKLSKLTDTLFSADMKRMELQFKVGLSGSEIIGKFIMKMQVEKVAKMALSKVGVIINFFLKKGVEIRTLLK
jgi:uncharacterized protein YwlG (UPF0340 family)